MFSVRDYLVGALISGLLLAGTMYEKANKQDVKDVNPCSSPVVMLEKCNASTD